MICPRQTDARDGERDARETAQGQAQLGELNSQVVDLAALLERLGLSNVDLRDVVKPNALAGALGAVLSGIAGFLSNLFLILVIMLFLIGEDRP